jgi:hypothetical protein
MDTFVPVRPPGWAEAAESPSATLLSIEKWLENAPLVALVREFGGELPAAPAGELLAWLDEFSARCWDFRAGQERNLAKSVEFRPPTSRLILEAATALGLVEASPPTAKSYDHLLILGGLVRACILRPRYAAQLLNDGLEVGSVSALSAYRPLRGDENDLMAALDKSGMSNEMEAMQSGLATAFGLGSPDDEQCDEARGLEYATSLVRTWQKHGLPFRLVIAPSPEPEARRANTADTYAFWADRCVHLNPGDHILLVTSSIYVPFQHADAVRMLALAHRCAVETVGVSFSDKQVEPPLRQPFTPANYLQEVRSTIRAVRALHATATDMTNRADGAS